VYSNPASTHLSLATLLNPVPERALKHTQFSGYFGDRSTRRQDDIDRSIFEVLIELPALL
jgi:hypothetical protein